MSIRRVLLTGVMACALVVAMASQAGADIAAFNAAVKANDYVGAAAEAAATWPTLDKSREDIGLIAREFGFAALVARDYSAAQSYAKFAVEHETGEFQSIAAVLQRLAEHKAGPSDQTWSNLLDALAARVAHRGVDSISLAAADTLIGTDLQAERPADARRSAEVAAKLAEAGGPELLPERRKFELYSKVAAYFEQEKMESYVPVRDHKVLIARDIEAAASEEAAKRLVPTYWETTVWEAVVRVHLGQRRWRDKVAKDGAVSLTPEAFPRLARLIDMEPSGCVIEPARAPFDMSGIGVKRHMGAVVLEIDIDGRGRASNPRVLASFPASSPFIDAYLRWADDWTYKAGRVWDRKTCSLARTNYTLTLTFSTQ